MYTGHIKTNIIHSFLSLGLADSIAGGVGSKSSSTTSLALCLADSLIKCYLTSSKDKSLGERDAVFDVRHQAMQYLKWWRNGYLSASGEPGVPDEAMQIVLRIWEEGLERGLPTVEILGRVEAEQSKIPNSSVSVVWVLPIALIFWRDRERAIEFARSAASVIFPTAKHLAGWYVNAVAAVLWESAQKQNLRVGKALLGRGFEAEFMQLGLQNTEAAEDVRKGVGIFLETSSFEEGLRAATRYHPQTSMAYAGIAGAWYGDGVKDEIKHTGAGGDLVKRVGGALGALAKVLEKKDEDEMQVIAASVPLDDEFEGML